MKTYNFKYIYIYSKGFVPFRSILVVVNDGFVFVEIQSTSAQRQNTRNHLSTFIAHNGRHFDVPLAVPLASCEFARDECQVEIISYVSWHNHFGKAHFACNGHVALHQMGELLFDLK